MSEQNALDLRELRGLCATVVTTGHVDPDYAFALAEMRAWCAAHGFTNIEWRIFNAQFVETGRDEAVQHTLKERYDWLLQIDADAAPIPPDAIARILHTAYIGAPAADVVGAYCQLKSPPYLPTVDTGTGTWEPHFPGSGILPVIRTGGHFLLAKRAILERLAPGPWFRSRRTLRPIDAIRELDNYARIKLGGENPFSALPEWERLAQSAKAESGAQPATVGEDSGFSDRVKAAGGVIVVDTNLVVGHMARKPITPADLKAALAERDRRVALACGVLE